MSTSTLAWNLARTAYDCPEKRPGHVVLRVRGFHNNHPKDDSLTVPPVLPNQAELGSSNSTPDDDSATTQKALWVGMTTSYAADYRVKSGGGKPRGANAPAQKDDTGRRGKSINQIIANGNVQIVPHDPKALRVVVSLTSSAYKLYALADPDKEGLCEALPTNIQETWYFPEYRDDDLVQHDKRKRATFQKITAALDELRGTKATAASTVNEPLEEDGRPPQFEQHPLLDRFRSCDQLMITANQASTISGLLAAYFPVHAYSITSADRILALAKPIRLLGPIIQYKDLRFVLVNWNARLDGLMARGPELPDGGLAYTLMLTLQDNMWFMNAKDPREPEDRSMTIDAERTEVKLEDDSDDDGEDDTDSENDSKNDRDDESESESESVSENQSEDENE